MTVGKIGIFLSAAFSCVGLLSGTTSSAQALRPEAPFGSAQARPAPQIAAGAEYGRWMMQVNQIQAMLEQALNAYSNQLDGVAMQIVQEAAQEVGQQAQQIGGGQPQRALRVARRQLNALAAKIEGNELQGIGQFRETALQIIRQLNQVQQIQQAQLEMKYQGIDEAHLAQYRQQLGRALRAYENFNDRSAMNILRTVHQDLQRQAAQLQQQGIRQAALERAAAQVRQLARKIANNDLQSQRQFEQSARQVLQQLAQRQQVQFARQRQGQYWRAGPRGQRGGAGSSSGIGVQRFGTRFSGRRLPPALGGPSSAPSFQGGRDLPQVGFYGRR